MLASVAIDLVAERAPELVKYIAAWIVELFNLRILAHGVAFVEGVIQRDLAA